MSRKTRTKRLKIFQSLGTNFLAPTSGAVNQKMRFKQFPLGIKIIDTNIVFDHIFLTPCQEIEDFALVPNFSAEWCGMVLRDKPSPLEFQNSAQRLLTQNLLGSRFLTQVGTRLKEISIKEFRDPQTLSTGTREW